jgi:tetratricopeptide (TPR) repeat protein
MSDLGQSGFDFGATVDCSDMREPLGIRSAQAKTAAKLWRGRPVWQWPLLVVLAVACVATYFNGGFTNESPSIESRAEAAYNNGWELSGQDRLEDAVAAYSEAIALDPDTGIVAQAYVNRSRVLGDLGRFDEAIADATAAIALDPDTGIVAQAYVNRSRVLGDLGRFDEAIADATAAIALDPETDILAVAYVNRTLACGSLGRFVEARADLVRIKELLPPTHDRHLWADQMLAELGPAA